MSHDERPHAAHRGGVSLLAVLFDLMRTLVVPRGTYGQQLAYVYHAVYGVSVDPERALTVTEEVRRRTRRTNDPEVDWVVMNREILAILAGVAVEAVDPEIAARVRPRLMSDQELYQVLPEMRAFLDRLAVRVPIGLASNYEGNVVDCFLDHFDLRRYLRPEWIFVSERIGGSGNFVDKPTARFWELTRATMGCPDDPRAVALVDDDTCVAVPAAHLGHPALLLDPCGHQLAGLSSHPLLFVCRSVSEVERALVWLGLPR